MKNIKAFQSLLKENNIDVYIIPTSDYHLNEYICDFFKERTFLSGFTGSAGTLLVTQNDAYLWTDGRYFIQASHELDNNIKLMKIGVSGIPNIFEFLKQVLNESSVIAFDAKTMSSNFALKIKKMFPKNILKTDINLVNNLWINRPSLPNNLIYKLDEKLSGEDYKSKLNRVLSKMNEAKANCHILAALEDQAWLYNLRGKDIKNNPLFLAFTIILNKEVFIFINEEKLTPGIKDYLTNNQIIMKPYEEVYEFVRGINDSIILLETNTINYRIYSSLNITNSVINAINPTTNFKAIKNSIEIENTKLAHLKDGLAMVKFIKWIYDNIDNSISELDVANSIDRLRSLTPNYIDLSFDTIAAFGPNAAMMHYTPSQINQAKISKNSFLLVDSGAHYFEGTTDITRTFAIGEVNDEMKNHYTLVLKGMINLAMASFLHGASGINLDILARGPLWKLYIDYKCGTGHGVGHILSVHEGPNSFRYVGPSTIFEPGMITTDEPGVYIENQYGIRIENELLTVSKSTNEYGSFLGFETLTICPIDTTPIIRELLTIDEIKWLNDYHNYVYEKLSIFLNDDEKEWLKEKTKSI